MVVSSWPAESINLRYGIGVLCSDREPSPKPTVSHLHSAFSRRTMSLAIDGLVPALTPKMMLLLRQLPQDLNPFHGRVGSDLVHPDEDGRVFGWINRNHTAES